MSQPSQLRPASRSKRSTTNLSHLRLAPLSAKYTEQPQDRHAPKSPYEEAAEATLAKYKYGQGRSASSTPGTSSATQRRRSGGGLSRRQSMYDDEASDEVQHFRDKSSDGDFAIAETAFTPGTVTPGRKKSMHKHSRSVGTTTPRSKSRTRADDDWLSHTGATANALLLESKGATWLSSRPSATNLVIADDDDEGYEEMAALSATTTRTDADEGTKTPKQDKWGSRFGSRPASRHASRRGSIAAGAMTPRNAAGAPDIGGYFEQHPSLQQGPVFVEDSEDETDDDEHLTELTKDKSFGLGRYVDKLMFNIFRLPDADESGAETGTEAETAAEAKARRLREAQRRQQEKDRLVAAPPAPQAGKDGDKVGVWEDANWLIGVASRAFS